MVSAFDWDFLIKEFHNFSSNSFLSCYVLQVFYPSSFNDTKNWTILNYLKPIIALPFLY
jgi:hypothetical protein